MSAVIRRVPGASFPYEAIFRNSAFDVERFLDSVGLGRKIEKFRNNDPIFAQGDAAKNVLYIQEGGVKLTVVNEAGKEVGASPRHFLLRAFQEQNARVQPGDHL